MEREVKRGDVWWVSVDGSIGWEMQTGRPAVVVSADGLNSKLSTVVIAYLTSNDMTASPAKVKVFVENKMSAVLCHQLRTVDQSRLTKYITRLSEDEMRRVAGSMSVVLCIPSGNSTPVPAPAPAPVKNDSTDVVALKVELDLLRKQYDKVLEKLVEKQVSEDIAKKTKAPEKIPAPAPAPVVEADPAKVEINSCTLEELRNIGCSQTVATSIMTHRPYKSVDDLKIVPWVTSTGFQILKNKVCCVPVIPPKYKMKPAPNKEAKKEKVNVNEASWQEISEKTGICETTARQIVHYRTHNGPFNKKKDLLNVPRIGERAYKKYEAYIEV